MGGSPGPRPGSGRGTIRVSVRRLWAELEKHGCQGGLVLEVPPSPGLARTFLTRTRRAGGVRH